MKRKSKNIIGQTTLEYAVVFAAVAAALVAMFSFLHRHVQGSYKEAADSFGGGRQYEAGVTDES